MYVCFFSSKYSKCSQRMTTVAKYTVFLVIIVFSILVNQFSIFYRLKFCFLIIHLPM